MLLFLELDRLVPELDFLVEDVLLEAAAARFVEPELRFADVLLPDFVPPRADEADFFEPEDRALDFEEDLLPPRAEDLEPLFEAVLAEDFDEDFEALFLAPLFDEDFEALLELPLADFLAPLFAEDFVDFLLPDEEPLFVEVDVVEPPEEPVVLV